MGLFSKIVGRYYGVSEGKPLNLRKRAVYEAAKQIADEGDMEAQVLVGNFLIVDDKNRNVKLGLKYLTMASEQGSDIASSFLGTMLLNGLFVEIDEERALGYVEGSLEVPTSMFNMGTLLIQGKAVPQDFEKAAEWFEKAGDGGVLEGYTAAATLHAGGFFGERDAEHAKEILRKGIEKGDKHCWAILGEIEKDPFGYMAVRVGRVNGEDGQDNAIIVSVDEDRPASDA